MNLFIPITLIVISIGVFFTFIDPNYQEIKKLQEVKRDYESKISKSEEIRFKRNKLAKIYAELEKNGDLDRLNKFLPDHINNIELIVDLDRIAKKNNIRIADISLSKDFMKSNQKGNGGVIAVSGTKDYDSTDLSFSFVSSYANFKNFINDLRKSLRLLDVTSVSFNQELNSDGKTVDNFKFAVTVRAYWLTDN